MLDIFGSVRGLLKTSTVCIDNGVFRLHYKGTAALLIVCSLLVTSRQYLGNPIDCMARGVNRSVINTYCWIHPTFTVPNALMKEVGKTVPYPGVATVQDGDEIKYHKYYQWVCFMLFFQATLFLVPRYLWKIWEAGKCKMLVMEMNCPIIDVDAKRDRKKLLVDFFHMNLHNNNAYAIHFFFCEILNFVNVICQMYLTDVFLGYEFTTYGTKVVQFANMDPQDRPDPMAVVFPKMTKCTFHKYGPSGTVQRLDALCVLPLNIINEKIYVFLWFWFTIVATVTGLSLLYRLAVVISPQVRLCLLRARARLTLPEHIATIARKSQIGDWFLLYQLGKNMEPLIFKEFLSDLSRRLKGEDID